MVPSLSLHLHPRFYKLRSFGSYTRRKIDSSRLQSSRFYGKSLGPLFKFNRSFSHGQSLTELSSITASASAQTISENAARDEAKEFNQVECLVWILHETARGFSKDMESLELTGSSAELALAWNGKDVHKWHKSISYTVAVYALLKVAIELEAETLLFHTSYNNSSQAEEILTPKINALGDYIENQLSKRQSELVEWFKIIEMPRIAGYFSPLLKKWSADYGGSGVAGIIVVISCCAAVRKLGPERISSPPFKITIKDVLIKLLDISCSLVSLEKLHHIAKEAGFEPDFLSHFGAKLVPGTKTEELCFLVGLAHRKLSAAFHKEKVLSKTQNLHEKVEADSLATLGLFAYLGRISRVFLLKKGIEDLDELVKDFLSYLECGSLFLYPELSCISSYQLFMEIVTDEVGWLDLYAAFSSTHNQDATSKHDDSQAEEEIALWNVCTVCRDVFSGFAHLRHSTQQPLNSELIEFLNRSGSLQTVCLEESLGVNDFPSSGLPEIPETGSSDNVPVSGKSTSNIPQAMGQKPSNLVPQGNENSKSQHAFKSGKKWLFRSTVGPDATPQVRLIQKCSIKFLSASLDVWMGTQLLYMDIAISMELLLKRLRGHKVTVREQKKLRRTLNDVTALIPITILMLIPISAIGHAAMLAAIRKYTPWLIPSPYSSERLDVLKQLKRTKKMEVHLWGKLEDQSTTL